MAKKTVKKENTNTEEWFFKITGTGSFTIIGSGMDVPAILISRDLVSWEEVIFRNIDNRYINYSGIIYIKAAKQILGMASGTTDNGVERISFCYFSFKPGSIASLGGNINALISPSRKLQTEPIGAYAFYRTFANCDEIIDARDLNLFVEPDYYDPNDEINIISNSSFRETFYNCVNLVGIPKFGNEKKKYVTIERQGCDSMFYGSGVRSATGIKINGIAAYGCQYMFTNCRDLEIGVDIITGSIGLCGCRGMFHNCNSLLNGQILDVSDVSERSCENMFNACSSLTSCKINATSISEEGGMAYMFYNCSSLSRIETRQTTFEGCFSWVAGVSSSGSFICDIETLKEEYPNPADPPDPLRPIETGISRAPSGWIQSPIPVG